jgi:hypothetical protein
MIIFREGNGRNGAGRELSSDGMIKSTEVLEQRTVMVKQSPIILFQQISLELHLSGRKVNPQHLTAVAFTLW